MNNQEQFNQYPQPQEIDLVDVIAVLWRRKVVVIGVVFICFAAILVMYSPKSKSTVSTLIMVGEITNQVDGNEVLQQIMSTAESQKLLKTAYLPQAISNIAQGDDKLFKFFSGNINVNDSDTKNTNKVPASRLVLISSSVSDLHIESVKTILRSATARLLELQNRTYKTHQDRIQNRIVAQQLQLKIQTDNRRIESEKLGLKSDRFSNEQKLEKNEDEELLKQEVLKHQKMLAASEKRLNAANRSLIRENAVLKRHEELIPILEERVKTIEAELLGVEKTRASLYKQLGGADSSSTLLTEALLAIDNRDSRYRSQIDALSQQLAIDIPQARVAIDIRLESLAEQIMSAEQDVAIATQSLAVFRVEKEYYTKEIVTSSGNIDTRFAAFEAAREAEESQLEADIVSLQLSLAQSKPSEILVPPTTTPSPKMSVKLIGLGALFVGGMLGCFVAFFLELLAQAKVRISESA